MNRTMEFLISKSTFHPSFKLAPYGMAHTQTEIKSTPTTKTQTVYIFTHYKRVIDILEWLSRKTSESQMSDFLEVPRNESGIMDILMYQNPELSCE